MQKVDIIKLAKKLKKALKEVAKSKKAYVSYSRRIEKIKTGKRICAMTFDDGPTKAEGLTESLVDILNQFGAKGTFDVIGTTENNYPDVAGKVGTPTWSGVKFDHYPCFEKDTFAGAVNCPELIEKILKSGHEITNHTYSHVLFGKKNIIYSSRNVLGGFDDVFGDVKRLHDFIYEKYNYAMRFSRPPHYVDKIKGGFKSYDVYSSMGYNYLAASFDGAGWLPCESEEEEIHAMVTPIENALKSNSDSLCGQIIFQKDGYNMSLRAPVMKGLEKQLKLLQEYGYEVVTVSELMEESPFLDVGRDDPDFNVFNELQRTHAIAFSDNTLRPDTIMTRGELAMLLAPREEAVNKRIENIKHKVILPYSLKASHPYSTAMTWAIENKLISTIKGKALPDKCITLDDINKLEDFFDTKKLSNVALTRRNVLKSFINK